jgi:hypothetical protein
MSRTIQYRCCKCRSLMFKHEQGKEEITETGMYAKFRTSPDGKKDVICLKCLIPQKIERGVLVGV